MNTDRKRFLKTALTGGVGFLLGGNLFARERWSEGGISLRPVRRKSLLMGSVVHFEVIAEKERDGYEAIRTGVEVFRELDAKLSMYRSDSEMTLLGKRAGVRPVELSSVSIEVLAAALQVYRESQGLFDITVEPAMRRWGFRNEASRPVERPTDRELQKLEKLIGSNRVELRGETAFINRKGMAVDLGGIAGGYALDRAVAEMRKKDIKAAFINFSGDIHCFGCPLEGSGWPVAILDPDTGQPSEHRLYLHDQALSTSGAYRNRRHDSKQRSWGHLVHPALARPVEPVGSVTAIHTSALKADAWSTALYVGAEVPVDVEQLVIP
ncbi:MAG: FAD:protein FMN transferase [Balneolaceae bacterium]|nr:FAD:protein FMN transferase [Balneolaceae bacterium]